MNLLQEKKKVSNKERTSHKQSRYRKRKTRRLTLGLGVLFGIIGLGYLMMGITGIYYSSVFRPFLSNNTGERESANDYSYAIIDTGQTYCYDEDGTIICPEEDDNYFGQDANYQGISPDYEDNSDGTIIDHSTGLMWQQSTDEKVTYEEAVDGADDYELAGHDDWRLPTIKELYSLINFDGKSGSSILTAKPYIDIYYFEFGYGNILASERYIDAQYWSSTEYVSTTMDGDDTVFGVNFADGRIKGYPKKMQDGSDKDMFVRYVRGNKDYGENIFMDNSDGTISDNATGLMWSKEDSGKGMEWKEALEWVQKKNDDNYLGYNDWRLPNAKEAQSIVDYTRAPDTSDSAAIDPIFNITRIDDDEYPYYWTSTSHLDGNKEGSYAVYISFGEAQGYMETKPRSDEYVLMDVHGAGAQRSDPKSGDADDYPNGHGPQGDVIRINNFIRLVRGGIAEVQITEYPPSTWELMIIPIIISIMCVVIILVVRKKRKKKVYELTNNLKKQE